MDTHPGVLYISLPRGSISSARRSWLGFAPLWRTVRACSRWTVLVQADLVTSAPTAPPSYHDDDGSTSHAVGPMTSPWTAAEPPVLHPHFWMAET